MTIAAWTACYLYALGGSFMYVMEAIEQDTMRIGWMGAFWLLIWPVSLPVLLVFFIVKGWLDD